jgi:hypothetical protein
MKMGREDIKVDIENAVCHDRDSKYCGSGKGQVVAAMKN